MGDHTTALAAAGGIVAALYEREQTGRGQQVSTSLMRTGAYVLSTELNAAASGSRRPAGLDRMMFNPLLAVYRSADEQWFWLLGVQATRHWPGICHAIGQPELIDDARFNSMEGLISNRAEVLAILDAAFTAAPMASWVERFAEHDVWWDPQQSFEAAVADPLMHGAGVIRHLADDPDTRLIATPVDFGSSEMPPLRRHPEVGQHTEEILLELGYDWNAVASLKDAGAIG
jgi:crotonobetainyl-CoA:carnitine CoA-transferase CaiB-like acyl-CoA transferase